MRSEPLLHARGRLPQSGRLLCLEVEQVEVIFHHRGEAMDRAASHLMVALIEVEQ